MIMKYYHAAGRKGRLHPADGTRLFSKPGPFLKKGHWNSYISRSFSGSESNCAALRFDTDYDGDPEPIRQTPEPRLVEGGWKKP
jgi:hypothetical protein